MGRYRAKDSAAPHPSGLRPATLSKERVFFFSKKGLLFLKTYDTMPRVPGQNIGMSPSGKAPDFDSGIRRFKSGHPSQHDPLAQLAEQLPFKQWVRGSNPRRVTRKSTLRRAFSLISEDQRPFEIKGPTVCCAHALAACGRLSSARFLILFPD